MSPSFEVVLGITHLLPRRASSLRAFSPSHYAVLSQRDGFSYVVKRQGRGRNNDRPRPSSAESPGKSLRKWTAKASLVIRDG